MVVIGLYNTKFGAVGGYSVWTLNLAEIPMASVVPVIPPSRSSQGVHHTARDDNLADQVIFFAT